MILKWKYLPSKHKIKVTATTIRTGINNDLRAILSWDVWLPGNKQPFMFRSWEEAITLAMNYQDRRELL